MEEQNPNYGPAPRTRPTGITILAVLYIIEGLYLLALPLFFTAMLSGMMGMPGVAAITGICWAVFGILALIEFLIAYGLLKGLRWARIAAIIFAIIGLLGIPIGTIISIIILWYLFKPEVKEWFE